MANDRTSPTFHFFGNVWLTQPEFFLNENDYEVVRQHMPLIHDPDIEWQHRPQPDLDVTQRFEEFVSEETEAWRQLGVERPTEFLLTPSGSINALLAHHLLNPTFFAADPCTREGFDLSNPTMHLLYENGFSAGERCLVFDQICRRTRTDDLLYLWTEDVQKPHDDFVRDLRYKMSAIVEICLGEHAWNKVKQHGNFVRFHLWDKHKDVRLFLKVEARKLKRFVFWVHHPQFFFRPRRHTTTNGVPDRLIQARIQDAALAFASSLVGLPIKQRFYERTTHGESFLALSNGRNRFAGTLKGHQETS